MLINISPRVTSSPQSCAIQIAFRILSRNALGLSRRTLRYCTQRENAPAMHIVIRNLKKLQGNHFFQVFSKYTKLVILILK